MSNEFYIQNLLRAREVMQATPDDRVELSWWQITDSNRIEDVRTTPDCGTIACFGGWIALSPMFPDVFVNTDRNACDFDGLCIAVGEPAMKLPTGKTIAGGDVSEQLFGCPTLFYSLREREELSELTDKQVVLQRINERLKELGHVE